ncbi:MAG: sulfatase-like hydrolase/transferase [Bacteroidetes bacterium]|nr:sulfatase-like hydrolase/transferase [Bacteroidota bacterium]
MNNIHTQGFKLFFFLLIAITFSKSADTQVVADSVKPNIVFIMVDDGRYDEYRVTGAPDWFVAPNIERIANEGLNFSRTYAPTPICGPSRASIYTGLYSHQHHTANNGDILVDSFTTIQQILKDQGYYTGFIGKYGNGFPPPMEFDYWVDIGDDEIYKNFWIKVNGSNVYVSGHITNYFNDYINHFMDSAALHSDKPFALFFFPLAPHTPNTPRSTDAGLYIGEEMPFPGNFYAYPSLYPEYYKEGGTVWVKDSAATKNFIEDRFACLIGVDDNVSKIMNRLDSAGITDSTFILFTSDNGYISGEHQMRAKAVPIDESIHVPLFVRYPTWFPDPGIVDNEIIELIDIPKTLLDVAGVNDTFNFQGYSLKQLVEPDTMRHFAYYEYEGSNPGDVFDVPDLRGIRGFDKAYFYSNCNCFSEEFYDFNLDPEQNQNLILNPDYYDEVQQYRAILAAMKLEKHDTLPYQINHCKLVGAYEIPDGIDNDCDGITDDSLEAFIRYYDFDNDGFGTLDSTTIVFGEIPGFVNNHLDCDDNNNLINPVAIEICDSIDNDCDGLIDDLDPDIFGLTTWYADIDADGFGDIATATTSCYSPDGYINIFGDCNDADSTITVGGIEICNGLDDNCDGLFDAADPTITGLTLYYADVDGDLFGDVNNTIAACEVPMGYTTDTTDCDDANLLINITGIEICNLFDDNCNGLTDDADPAVTGTSIWYADADADGYGILDSTTISCFLPAGYATLFGDCNDANAAIHPLLTDICDGLDNDCDILIDEDIIIPDVTASGPTTFCQGGMVILSATPIISGYNLQWFKNGVVIPGANGLTYNATATGNYKITYTAPAGCITESLIKTVSVNANPKPVVSNSCASNDLCVNNPVKLSVKNKVGSTFQWYKGATPLAGAITNKYNATTTGNYKCQQIDASGCIGTSKVFAVVNTCREGDLLDFSHAETVINLYPNPNNGVFTLSVSTDIVQAATAQIRITNIIGELIYEDETQLTDGAIEKEINITSGLASGIYIVVININQTQWFRQLVIE